MGTDADPIGLLGPGDARAAGKAAGVPGQLAGLNVFRLLLHRPAHAKGVSDLLLSLMAAPALDPRLRELAIMRVAWRTGSAYEWAQHWRLSASVGVDPGEVAALRDGGLPTDPEGAAVVRATDEVLDAGEASPAALEQLRDLLGDDAAIETVAAAAAWTMVSTLLRTFRVPLDDDLETWPPDGRAPAGGQ